VSTKADLFVKLNSFYLNQMNYQNNWKNFEVQGLKFLVLIWRLCFYSLYLINQIWNLKCFKGWMNVDLPFKNNDFIWFDSPNEDFRRFTKLLLWIFFHFFIVLCILGWIFIFLKSIMVDKSFSKAKLAYLNPQSWNQQINKAI